MKPQKISYDSQMELFKVELKRLVDSAHPLIKLTDRMDWKVFDDYFEPYFSDEGRPAIATRLMVSLHYLKYTYDLSDEETVARWTENPFWQYFSGRQHFECRLPIEPSSMTRWRKRMGKDGMEELLKQTIQTAIKEGHVKTRQCERVNVDTTVQTKDIRFPTDARLYDRMREVLARIALAEGIELRQTYERVGKAALRRQQNYAHAKQGRRARRQTKFLRTILGRMIRDIGRKACDPSDQLKEQLALASRLYEQKKDDKNKLYSIHEPQVECIAKGKAHQRYEFGCKVGLVTTAKGNWILGAQAFSGNPYDGHTLERSLDQTRKITGVAIEQAACDQGYRGHGVDGSKILIVPRNKKNLPLSIRRWYRRRNAIEPIIGHQKSDHRLERNRLAGPLGDQLNAILAACGFNFKKLLRAFCLWFRWLFPTLLRVNF